MWGSRGGPAFGDGGAPTQGSGRNAEDGGAMADGFTGGLTGSLTGGLIGGSRLELPPVEVLLERVSKRQSRPLLETGDKREILAKLMADRYPVYALADRVVDSNNGSHDRVVEQVMALLS